MDSELIEFLQALVPNHAGIVTRGVIICELYDPSSDGRTLAVYGGNVAPWDALGMMKAVSEDVSNLYASIPTHNIHDEDEDYG